MTILHEKLDNETLEREEAFQGNKKTENELQ